LGQGNLIWYIHFGNVVLHKKIFLVSLAVRLAPNKISLEKAHQAPDQKRFELAFRTELLFRGLHTGSSGDVLKCLI
jgi:hypothetical protein